MGFAGGGGKPPEVGVKEGPVDGAVEMVGIVGGVAIVGDVVGSRGMSVGNGLGTRVGVAVAVAVAVGVGVGVASSRQLLIMLLAIDLILP